MPRGGAQSGWCAGLCQLSPPRRKGRAVWKSGTSENPSEEPDPHGKGRPSEPRAPRRGRPPHPPSSPCLGESEQACGVSATGSHTADRTGHRSPEARPRVRLRRGCDAGSPELLPQLRGEGGRHMHYAAETPELQRAERFSACLHPDTGVWRECPAPPFPFLPESSALTGVGSAARNLPFLAHDLPTAPGTQPSPGAAAAHT